MSPKMLERIACWIGVVTILAVTLLFCTEDLQDSVPEATSANTAPPAPTFKPSGKAWQEVSRDRPIQGGLEIVVGRIPLSTKDGWIYRCTSSAGDVDLVVVPDDHMPE